MLPFDWWMDSEGNCLLSRWETLRISSFGVITPNLDGSFVQVAHGLVPGRHQSAYVSSWVRLWRCAVLLGANGPASGTSGVSISVLRIKVSSLQSFARRLPPSSVAVVTVIFFFPEVVVVPASFWL